jgi:hypothetical protein
LAQLQQWARTTATKNLAQLEAEFQRLQAQPRPPPSPEFVKSVFST